VIISLIVFGLLKALASGSQAVDRGALRLFTAGLVIEIVGIFVAPLFATRANYTVEVLTRCLSQAQAGYESKSRLVEFVIAIPLSRTATGRACSTRAFPVMRSWE